MNTKQDRSKSSTRRWLIAPIRFALIIAIAGAGWSVTRGFGRLISDWRQASTESSSRDAHDAGLNMPAVVLPLAGHWSFADLEWNLKSDESNRAEIDARFEVLAATASQAAEKLPDVSPELIELAEALRIEPTERGGNQIYRLTRTDLNAQLVVRWVAGKRKVVSVAAAYSKPGGQWQLVELSPRAANANREQHVESLLPLPAEARRKGGRFDEEGRLLMELVSLDSNSNELIADWKKRGWEVRPTGLGEAGSFRYLCARGKSVIYAWSASRGDRVEHLMLVRTPDDVNFGS